MNSRMQEDMYEEKPAGDGTESQQLSGEEAKAEPENPDGAAENAAGELTGDGAEAAGAEDAGAEDAGDSGAAEAADAETGAEGDEETPAQDGGPEPGADGKWHVFGKKKEKKDPKDQKIEELTDQLKRQMAEFDNFRKRTEKEKSAMFEVGARSIIEKMLPVIDNFERGLATVPEDAKGTPFAEGMDMIYKQLLKNLEEAGVKPIEAVGQPFDPNFHNAVMHVEDENLGENVVAQEFQKGYMYRDTVIRHSMVQVAN